MFPRLLLLFAFIIISFKIFHIIYTSVFKLELCNDDFYTGGIKNTRPKGKLSRGHVAAKMFYNQGREGKIKQAASYKRSSELKSNVSYRSYETYKKINC